MIGASLLFAAADRALTRAWTAVVDPEHAQPPRDMERIYARGVLMKYLPGSIFQYVSRQVEGAKTGIAHKLLAKSIIVEVGLHLRSEERRVGKECAVRVDLGGRRIIQKKTTLNKRTNIYDK